jgi:hypothetical protein
VSGDERKQKEYVPKNASHVPPTVAMLNKKENQTIMRYSGTRFHPKLAKPESSAEIASSR